MSASGPADDGGADPDETGGGSDNRGWIRQLTALGHVGMMFPVAIAIGFFAGRWLDAQLGTDPWLSLTGFALGIAAALRNLIQSVNRLEESERRDEEAGSGSARGAGGEPEG